jgi:hypothetical protein
MEVEGEAVEQEQLQLVREVAKREETVASQDGPVAPHGIYMPWNLQTGV